MNRKSAIKRILIGTAVILPSASLYEWLHAGSGFKLDTLYKKKQLIADLAEVIIPRTDTPGAKDAKVEDFILKMITENTDVKSRQNFLSGLSDLEKYTFAQYLTSFSHCSKQHKIDVLTHFQNKAFYRFNILNKVSNRFFGQPFFFILKNLTVLGYCTSVEGATMGMAYDHIPVNFEACVPLLKDQKAWATK